MYKDLLEKQRQFYDTGITRDISFRIKQLKRISQAIKDNEEALLTALGKDLGKSDFEAYATEIGYVQDSIKHFIKHIKKWTKAKRVKSPLHQINAKTYIHIEPYGNVLIIGPFNYPFQLVMEPLIGAIAAGNTAIVKPSEYAEETSRVLEKIITDLFEEAYIALVRGHRDTTSALLELPVDYIFFTGSVPVGKIVQQAAAKHLTPITLELGGKSPAIVHYDANLSVTAKRIVWGKFMNAGQTCIAPDYVLVHEDLKDKLLGEMKKVITTFYGEDPLQSEDYGKIINRKHYERLLGLIEEDKVYYGGQVDKEKHLIGPTILDQVSLEDPIMEDEIFGPLLPVISYKNKEEAKGIIRSFDKPLALYVFTEQQEIQEYFMKGLSFGGGCINDTLSHVVSPYAPFGGVGASGIGAYHGKESIKTFSHRKTIVKKSSRFDISFIYPPYKGKLKFLKMVMK